MSEKQSAAESTFSSLQVDNPSIENWVAVGTATIVKVLILADLNILGILHRGNYILHMAGTPIF